MSLNKKNIVIVSGVFPPEPVTSAILNYDLAEKLGEYCSVIVLSPKPTRPYGAAYENISLISDKFKHIIVDSYTYPQSKLIGRLRESYSFGHKCAQYIRENYEHIDFVYNASWQLFGLYIVAKQCVHYNIPYIVPVQDIYPESLLEKIPKVKLVQSLVQLILKPIDKYYLYHATKIRTITNDMADYLSATRDIQRDKFLVIANWQNDASFIYSSVEYRKDGIIRFMFAGSINERAKVDLLIDAFVKANVLNSELYIMGDGPARQIYVDMVKLKGINNVFFSEIPKGKVAQIQSKADVLILALPMGGGKLAFPSKLTAYMLSGKPILACMDLDCAAAKIIKNENCGLVASAGNVESLSRMFVQMSCLSIDYLKEMGDNSRKYAIQYLSKKNNLELLTNEINHII